MAEALPAYQCRTMANPEKIHMFPNLNCCPRRIHMSNKNLDQNRARGELTDSKDEQLNEADLDTVAGGLMGIVTRKLPVPEDGRSIVGVPIPEDGRALTGQPIPEDGKS